jgi:L-amino acid N-acyltransferase YncA
MKVREAAESDLPEIVAIYNATIPSRMVTADTAPVSVASRTPWFRAHDPRHRPLWVVGEPGRIRAWLSFNNFHERPAYRPTAEISLYVAQTERRQGLGRWLLAEAIARAPACGVQTLVGLIWAHNEPSLRLFGQAGFARWGHLPRVAIMDEVERDLVIVGRRVVDP